MDTLRKRWILSILLLYNLTDCFAAAGPPARPLRPECCMPCDEKICIANIHCTWDQGPDPHSPTIYILHWEPTNSEEERPKHFSSSSTVIDREHFFHHEELRVWVEAKNQHGSVFSEENVFNISNITKPPPPTIILKQKEPLEIEWHSFCSDLHFSIGTCDVRIRIENDVWLEHEGGFFHTYTFDSPLPGTVYEFQVRCACSTGLMSNWSTIHKLRSAEKAPLGELNVWKDCGTSPASFDCALSWKKLPLSQARGVIVGYEVGLFYNNGTATLVNVSTTLVNVSTTEPRGQLFCSDMQCYFPSSLKDVSSVRVSAFNAHGATVPSHLIMPTPAKNENEQPLNLKMIEENLTVSWDQSSVLPHILNEYVVQYKQVGCPPGQGFDWIKVGSSQETVFFKGHFKKYTPYQVSLFSVSHDNVHHLSSVIGYSLEGTPSSVPLLKVFSIAATQVTLFWECVPLSMQNGLIRYYQLGTDEQNVYNVSASSQCESRTFEVKHLRPGQEYKVWIRAVTGAGPGENTTARFITKKPQENDVYLLPALLALVLIIICIVILLSYFRGENKMCQYVTSCLCEKVPDPRNSQIFRHVKHQFNDPLAWICLPMYEQHPTISVLEVIKIQSNLKKTSDVDEKTKPAARDGCSYKDCQEEQSEDAVSNERDGTDHRCEREEYTKMVDSDEEGDREEDKDDCSSSSEEQQFTGYEKHFMPNASEILNV